MVVREPDMMRPGLATLVMAKILLMAEQNEKSIAISCYEVYQEHVQTDRDDLHVYLRFFFI
jgi:hypothetical protein